MVFITVIWREKSTIIKIGKFVLDVELFFKMKNLGTKNKIIIGVVIGLLAVLIGVILVLSLSKKEDKIPENTVNISEKLASASMLEVVITEDKKIDLSNIEMTKDKSVKVWAFSSPVYLGEFSLVNVGDKYYLEGMEDVLKTKYITNGDHKVLILQDDKVVGYFNIRLSEGNLLSSSQMSDGSDVKNTDSDNNDSKVNNTDKNENNVNNENKNNVNNENNSNDINTNENKTSTKKLEVEEDIKYTTEEIKETNMLKGKKETIVKGIIGKKKITYNVTYDKNNKEIKREKVSETVVSEPVNEQVKVGISDYNLNDKPTYGLETGLFCLEDEASGFDYKQCDDENLANKNNYYQTISVGNKQYLICMDSSICSDYYDYQFKLSSHPVVSKYKDIYTVTMNGTKYYLDSRAGSDGRELNEEICTELGLVCNRW